MRPRQKSAGSGLKFNTPLEDYAMIGDGETAALVSRRGSIDWLCLPRFDSPACCAALVGTPRHGRWSIAPDDAIERTAHRYQEDTLILETDITTAAGTIRLTDFMPIASHDPAIIRMVTGVSGSVPTCFDAAFRFDYGRMPPWVSRAGEAAVMHVGPDRVAITGLDDFEITDNSIISRFVVEEGGRHVFVLTYGKAHEPLPEAMDTEHALADTQAYWRRWIGRFNRPAPYTESLRRSLLTLKALIHRPTGGLIAAPTTSLPEQPGGPMNWDYRYCWLRDAAFTFEALLECGFVDDATAWRDWLLRAIAGEPDLMQILYRVDGSRRLDEAELSWLPGYRFARPVRIGNAAAAQFQLDTYGELLRTLHISERGGMERTDQGRHLEHAIIDHLQRVWVDPDQGFWESRGEARHFTYSKVMAWVAVHRFLDGKSGEEISGDERKRLSALCDRMHDLICREGFDPGLGSFTSYFGGREIDASLLLLPKVGFLPADDERMAGTVDRIERELVVDGFVKRHHMNDLVPEGAFLACSFWLAECQLGQGRRSDAVKTIETALSVRSDLGLLSEEYDVGSRRLSGNYPQALSHLALVHALLALEKFDRTGRT
jgi:GH15 family glucan-1,4-alpha-glucosidase